MVLLCGWPKSTSTVSRDLCPNEGVTGPRTRWEKHRSVHIMIQGWSLRACAIQGPLRSQGLSRHPAALHGRAPEGLQSRVALRVGRTSPGSREKGSRLDLRHAAVVGPSRGPPSLPTWMQSTAYAELAARGPRPPGLGQPSAISCHRQGDAPHRPTAQPQTARHKGPPRAGELGGEEVPDRHPHPQSGESGY